MTIRKGVIHSVCICHECEFAKDGSDAEAQAKAHARKTGHSLELKLGYRISKQ